LNVASHVIDIWNSNPEFPLRHFVRCEKCGVPLTGSKSTGSKGGRYRYYRCRNPSCGAVQCRAEKIEADFVDFLKAVEPRPETSALLAAIMRDLVQQRTEEARREARRLTTEITELENRKSIALAAFLYRKEIDRDTYEGECARLNQAIEAKRHQLSGISTAELSDRVLEGLTQLLTNASGYWLQFPATLRRRFQGVMFPCGMTYADARFGTQKMCPFLGLNVGNPPTLSEVASPTGFEPVFWP
jgi:site-specific DNA recombinase